MRQSILTSMFLLLMLPVHGQCDYNGYWSSQLGYFIKIRNCTDSSFDFFEEMHWMQGQAYKISDNQFESEYPYSNMEFKFIDDFRMVITDHETNYSDTLHRLVYKIKIIRDYYGYDCTTGKIYANGHFIGYTLEYPWRENEAWDYSLVDSLNEELVSCIPKGFYKGKLKRDFNPDKYEKYKYRIQLEDKIPRSAIQLHLGNRLSGKITKGCILIGDSEPSDCEIYNGEIRENIRRSLEQGLSWNYHTEEIKEKLITITIEDSEDTHYYDENNYSDPLCAPDYDY